MESTNKPVKIQRNYSFDFLKFVSSFFIVCIHFKMFGKTGDFVAVLSRFAVPVFFMVSGYYSRNNDRKKIKCKIINILKLYLFTVILYFCFNVLEKIFNGQLKEAVWYISTYLRIQYTFRTVLFNESVTAIHLWFLGALIYSYVIQYFINESKIRERAVYIISCILLLTHLVLGIGSSFSGIEMPAFMEKNYVLRNFLFMGFPLFTFGRYINKNESDILKYISWKYIILFILLSIADVVAAYMVDSTRDLYLSSVLTAFVLFVISLKGQNRKYHKNLITVFNTSTDVYLFHVMAGDILSMTLLGNMRIYMYIKPVIVFFVSVIISLLIKYVVSLFKNRT